SRRRHTTSTRDWSSDVCSSDLVVHRPFYLDPVGRKVFARCAQVAYGMWKAYAASRGLPWLEISTFEVALREEDQGRLEKYRQWGLANGMREDELELLTPSDVRRYEPNVRCHGAIWSKTDTAVDYREFTQSVRDDAEAAGAPPRGRATRSFPSSIRTGSSAPTAAGRSGRTPSPSRGRTRTAASSTARKSCRRNSSRSPSATSSGSS